MPVAQLGSSYRTRPSIPAASHYETRAVESAIVIGMPASRLMGSLASLGAWGIGQCWMRIPGDLIWLVPVR